MAERKLDELIGKLKALKIQEASILSQIAELDSNITKACHQNVVKRRARERNC
jgi:chaperonin cofactor prefoldin